MMSLRMMPHSLLCRPNITRGLKNAKLVSLQFKVRTYMGISNLRNLAKTTLSLTFRTHSFHKMTKKGFEEKKYSDEDYTVRNKYNSSITYGFG